MDWAGTYGKYYISAQRHIDAVLPHVTRRQAVIQAGGHVGQFPVYLASHFKSVYTWEPMPNDFRDLITNIELAGVTDRVFACRGMLGAKKSMGLMQDAGSGSSHRNINKEGDCPIYCIDDLALPHCGLIYLDVEGDEVPILQGGEELIRRCHPVIVTEERGKGAMPTENFLAPLGYKMVGKWMADAIWVHHA